MRRLHLLHIIALVTLFCMGIYWLGRIEMVNRTVVMDTVTVESMEDFERSRTAELALTRLAAFAGMVVFAFSAVVGWRVSLERRVLGILWLLVSAGAVVWMLLMWKTPTHISLDEVFPAWIVYSLLGIAGSVYCLVKWQGTSVWLSAQPRSRTDILDS